MVATEGDIFDGRTIADLLGAAAMNDSGQVAFHAKIESDKYLRGIFVDENLVFLDGDTVDGTPVWTSKPLELRKDGSVLRIQDSKIIVGNHAILKKGDVIDEQVFYGLGNYVEADINSAGAIAFCGYFEQYADPPAIATLDRIVAEVGDVMDGKVLTGVVKAHINDAGEVSYLGSFNGIQGIFTENRLVVAVGDTIDGQTLTTISYGFEVNNAGEIVLEAAFENDRGIFTQNRLIAQIQ